MEQVSGAKEYLEHVRNEIASWEMKDVIEVLALANRIRDVVIKNRLGMVAFDLVAAEIAVVENRAREGV